MIEQYFERNWKIIPLAPKAKHPYHDSWNTRDFAKEDFGPDDNVGIRLDVGIVDVDLDQLEAVAVASAFLPATGAVFGRKSKPRSHYLYACPDLTEPIVFNAPEGGKPLLELRVGQKQETMLPPSIHPSGESVEWSKPFSSDTILGEVSAETLKRRASLVACCALVVKYYFGAGERHDWCLAVSGTLRQLSVLVEEASLIVKTAAIASGDHNVEDRLTEVRTTYARSEDDPTAGFRALKELSAHLANGLRSVLGDTIAIRGFIGSRSGGIATGKPENIRRALQKMKIELKFDLFSKDKILVEKDRERRIEDGQVNDLWISIDDRFNFLPPWELFNRVLDSEARQNSYHPVRDYLEALTWDKVPRLDSWLHTYGKASDTEYTRHVGSLILRAAVRRVFEPGIKWDELLVLESPQGFGKSSMLLALCPEPHWFSDDLPIGVDSKIVIERTRGIWIVEIAELFGMSKKEVDQVKGFLSRGKDGPVRLAYGRDSMYTERQFICIGTTNRTIYLKDNTGNRRFWPVRVGRFDIAGIEKDRDQIWAEATSRRYEPIRMRTSMWGEAQNQQQSREAEDPWQIELEDILAKMPEHYLMKDKAGQLIFPENGHEPQLRMTLGMVYDSLGIQVDRRDTQNASRISDILVKLGFRKMTVSKGNIVTKGWGRD